ncbi:tRNA (adenosine(37)-N6)-threonylcarbamoyltransferase complex ATPase subunit type 1 TsaE [Frigoriflavimonas asaccharolytica]|uniref:tRNA threonylcarbamoyladenosine biosynthesis protein TsaE n=1 Tax=Frigoriflavimonas asaccharolytica TaxID=2735899 RepID=A0A8J8G9U2_9FLAO|nr:tRNA (adenosine(37)-N6)-threonylcarbamoyltransferase complex ATPase subunit type 1 TsaE [Frigoriflavimonas asaccharolytica]NRS92577.1 tRNA threonylcarbamoyladenosine biosynthesis protein TsaE [Frigoriflavimonas asaccharolytica]
MTIKIEKVEDWKEVVKNLFPKIEHRVILLKGNLGAGKTTFTQQLLKKMGVIEQVSSPTYSIVNEYKLVDKKIYHFDLYRINTKEEVFDMGFEEYLENENFCIVEWPEIYEDELSDIPHHTIEISHAEIGRILHFV